MRFKILDKPFVAAFASALLLGLAYNFPRFGWPLAFIGLIPLFFSLERVAHSFKKTFLIGTFFGTLYIGFATLWLLQSFPLDWARIPSPMLGSAIIIFVWLTIAITLGLFPGLWAILQLPIRRLCSPTAHIFPAAATWTILEYLRTYAFSFVWAGQGSVIGEHWSFGVFGNALSWSPLLPLASVGGEYLLSFVVVSVNLSLFLIIRRIRNGTIVRPLSERRVLEKTTFIALGFFFLVVFFIAFSQSDKRIPADDSLPPISVALVHSSFPERLTDDVRFEQTKFDAYTLLLSRIKKEARSPEMLIFPEDARVIVGTAPEARKLLFPDILGTGDHLVIDSAHMINDGRPTPTAFLYNTEGSTLSISQKQILIPNGEYLPRLTSVLLGMLGKKEIVDDFLETRGFSKGNIVSLGRSHQVKVGILHCSEIFSPSLLRNAPLKDSDLIVNLASHAIFHGSALLDNQTLSLLKLRAVENGVPILVAGNLSPSLAIDRAGNILFQTNTPGATVSYLSIPSTAKKTIYHAYPGTAVSLLCLISLLPIFFALTFDKCRRFLSRRAPSVV